MIHCICHTMSLATVVNLSIMPMVTDCMTSVAERRQGGAIVNNSLGWGHPTAVTVAR
jgi:hypothetical protein